MGIRQILELSLYSKCPIILIPGDMKNRFKLEGFQIEGIALDWYFNLVFASEN